jgi:hypothetical protein
MSRGETQLDADLDLETAEEPVTETTDDEETDGGVRDRVRAGAGRIVSGRALVLALTTTVVGAVLVGGAVPLGIIGTLLGVVVAAFVYGTLTGTNRYLEFVLAGSAVGGGSTFLGNLTLSLLGPGVPLVAVGAVAGAFAGVLGHYSGRDLRDGLTRDI